MSGFVTNFPGFVRVSNCRNQDAKSAMFRGFGCEEPGFPGFKRGLAYERFFYSQYPHAHALYGRQKTNQDDPETRSGQRKDVQFTAGLPTASQETRTTLGAPHAGALIGGGHARGFGRIAGESLYFEACTAFPRPHETPALSRFPISKKAGQNQRFPTFSAPKTDLNSDPMTANLVVAAKTTNKIMVIHA